MLKRVIVCLSQTLVTSGPLDILESEKIIRQQGEAQPIFQVNPADRCALEIALQLKKNSSAEIIALSFTPPDETTVLNTALACGADRCIHLVHPADSLVDGWVTASMISNYLSGILETSDLILCGDSLADTAGAQVGPFIAELLNLPQITRVISTAYQSESNNIEAVRLLERGDRQRVACALPALASASRFGSPARYIAVLNKQQALISQIETITADPAAVGVHPLCQIKSITRPRPRVKKVSAPSAKLSAAERMKFLMSGGKAKQDSTLFEGSPEEAADRILSYLQENNLIDD